MESKIGDSYMMETYKQILHDLENERLMTFQEIIDLAKISPRVLKRTISVFARDLCLYKKMPGKPEANGGGEAYWALEDPEDMQDLEDKGDEAGQKEGTGDAKDVKDANEENKDDKGKNEDKDDKEKGQDTEKLTDNEKIMNKNVVEGQDIENKGNLKEKDHVGDPDTVEDKENKEQNEDKCKENEEHKLHKDPEDRVLRDISSDLNDNLDKEVSYNRKYLISNRKQK